METTCKFDPLRDGTYEDVRLYRDLLDVIESMSGDDELASVDEIVSTLAYPPYSWSAPMRGLGRKLNELRDAGYIDKVRWTRGRRIVASGYRLTPKDRGTSAASSPTVATGKIKWPAEWDPAKGWPTRDTPGRAPNGMTWAHVDDALKRQGSSLAAAVESVKGGRR